MTRVWINRIGTAVPDHDIHAAFVAFGRAVARDPHRQALFDRLTAIADIEHRYSFFKPAEPPYDPVLDVERFFVRGAFPATAARMARYETQALELGSRAVAALDIAAERRAITHLIVASCTGFTAPGLDFQLMRKLGLRESVERTIVGFMGCFAAVNALKLARHIVRSEPASRVLVVNVEICSLHLQENWELEKMLSFLLFGDGASAALVSANAGGIELGDFRATTIGDTDGLITWHIGDSGFDMHLSGQVPGRIRRWLRADGAGLLGNRTPNDIGSWAVHAGGRSILDAVQTGLNLPPGALDHSRAVLREFGNMSSATLMFVLGRILAGGARGQEGVAMAFGPGLTVETFGFSH